jgi:uncharacterized protein YyaL (SSP411 family)
MLEVFTITGAAEWIDEAEWGLICVLERFGTSDSPELAIGRSGGLLPFQSFDRYDGATPSTNSLFAWTAYRVGFITSNTRLLEAAKGLTHAYASLIERVPSSFSILCWTLAEQELGTTEVLIPGNNDELLSVALASTRGDLIVVHGEASPLLDGLDDGAAYLCHNRICQLPTTDPDALARALREVQ